ncbi:hypothetical protein [Microvirga guangxiensis]|uniref:hypothetical protein n=1 Tax=Microvirga guangxiensis TaxID=549386 RepID=UPI000B86E6BA|nr:hypothetical protein [Microvirga guangxiensis]
MSHSHGHHGHHHHHGHEHHDHGHHAHEPRSHAPRVLAAAPAFSLLRLSIWQRLAGSGVLLAALWLMVFGVMG